MHSLDDHRQHKPAPSCTDKKNTEPLFKSHNNFKLISKQRTEVIYQDIQAVSKYMFQAANYICYNQVQSSPQT